MTPEQRYLFDINGYLHIPDVLSEAELATAREAIERYVTSPEEELPEGFSHSEDGRMQRTASPGTRASSPSSSIPSCGPSSWNSPTIGPACMGAAFS